MIISKRIWEFESSIINFETAFLHAEMNAEICMNIHEGINDYQDHCLQIKRKMYNLVQSAREFCKKLFLVIKSIGFMENKSDPCLLSNWNGKEVILIGIYVDECLVIGEKECI
jgi:hypothetical protein